MFGKGFYTSSVSSSESSEPSVSTRVSFEPTESDDYAQNHTTNANSQVKAMFLSNVEVGRAQTLYQADNGRRGPDHGYDSVSGRHGAPAAGLMQVLLYFLGGGCYSCTSRTCELSRDRRLPRGRNLTIRRHHLQGDCGVISFLDQCKHFCIYCLAKLRCTSVYM